MFGPAPRHMRRGHWASRLIRRDLGLVHPTASAVAFATQPKGCGAHPDVSRVARVRVR